MTAAATRKARGDGGKGSGDEVPTMFGVVAAAFDGWSPGGVVVGRTYVVPPSVRARFPDADARLGRLLATPPAWREAWGVDDWAIR